MSIIRTSFTISQNAVGGEIVIWGKINLGHKSTFNKNNLHFTKR